MQMKEKSMSAYGGDLSDYKKKMYIWEKKVIDPLDRSICKQKIKKRNLLALKF